MYFTIPQDILGVGDPISDTVVYLDDGVVLSSSVPAFRHKFGEGYSLTLPTGPRKRTFSGTFMNRDSDLISIIDRYFTYLANEPINDFHILGVSATVSCKNWNKITINEDLGSLQAQFEETFR